MTVVGARTADSASEGDGAADSGQNVTTVTDTEASAETAANATSSSPGNSTSKVCACAPLNHTAEQLTVRVFNSSTFSDQLLAEADEEVRSRAHPARCLLVLFYGRTCPFSAAAAPHVNALPRAFPDLGVTAVDVLEDGSLNTKFGIIAVPTVILFHNGRAQARFNHSEPTLQRLADFVSAHTQLTPTTPLNVTEEDWLGPLPSEPADVLDWYLVAAWAFIAACAAFGATKLRLWRRAADVARNWWIEAEQHLHEE